MAAISRHVMYRHFSALTIVTIVAYPESLGLLCSKLHRHAAYNINIIPDSLDLRCQTAIVAWP